MNLLNNRRKDTAHLTGAVLNLASASAVDGSPEENADSSGGHLWSQLLVRILLIVAALFVNHDWVFSHLQSKNSPSSRERARAQRYDLIEFSWIDVSGTRWEIDSIVLFTLGWLDAWQIVGTLIGVLKKEKFVSWRCFSLIRLKAKEVDNICVFFYLRFKEHSLVPSTYFCPTKIRTILHFNPIVNYILFKLLVPCAIFEYISGHCFTKVLLSWVPWLFMITWTFPQLPLFSFLFNPRCTSSRKLHSRTQMVPECYKSSRNAYQKRQSSSYSSVLPLLKPTCLSPRSLSAYNMDSFATLPIISSSNASDIPQVPIDEEQNSGSFSTTYCIIS